MGTRSKTSFIEKRGEKLTHLVSVYQQYDGYISGVGHDIAKYILSKQICNGIGLGRDTSNLANGFTCLIAQFIRDFKTDVGGLYITMEDEIQEYNYNIIFDSDLYYRNSFNEELETDKYFKVKVIDWNEQLIFEGTLKELLDFKESDE
jgi:hypothetical protein